MFTLCFAPFVCENSMFGNSTRDEAVENLYSWYQYTKIHSTFGEKQPIALFPHNPHLQLPPVKTTPGLLGDTNHHKGIGIDTGDDKFYIINP